jgi:uncharacterized integral membrane protein (TIGR00697 family)
MSRKSLYTIVVALSVAVLLVSNIASTKLFDFFGTGLAWDGGAILFPLSYILGDAITEIYGFRTARRVILVTLAMNVLAAGALFLVQILPPAAGWEHQVAYQTIIGSVLRLIAASLVAYAVGAVANAYVFSKIKVATKGRRLWLRALGSSMVGDLIDTLIFVSVAFYGTISTTQFVGLIAIAYVTKLVGETVLLPVTYRVIKFMRKITGDDHYDKRLRLRNLFH